MPLDLTDTRNLLAELIDRSASYFDGIKCVEDDFQAIGELDPDFYWSQLNQDQQQSAIDLQGDLLVAVKAIANCLQLSSLTTEADLRDVSKWTKSARASLRLRRFYAWDSELLHDEGAVLGIQQAGQSDEYPFQPAKAKVVFRRECENLLSLIDILSISPFTPTDGYYANPQITANYEPDSAFIMMPINPEKPELEDLHLKIKECFCRYRIKAVRSDEIEHEEKITDKIIEKIKTSEFLFVDLTYELPNVYYEVGFAHSLGRKVIMYRKKGTRIHFDLKDYNCPSYTNLTDLEKQLMRRLEHMTNRRPKAIPISR